MPSTSSVDLDNMSEYPLFARTHPSNASMAQLSIDYLATQLHINFVAILYLENNASGNSYHAKLLQGRAVQ
jgi:ABC-type branched-subunit amino acid transport system substrate-binding protein